MRRFFVSTLLLGFVAVLVWSSFHLAGIRIFQVDECQNIYVAGLLTSGQTKTAFTSISLFVLPLTWLCAGAAHSIDMFVSARCFSFELFWLNLVLLAVATGQSLFSVRGLVALASAATLAPLWDYGFEIRHDNLLLTGLLLMWCVIRIRPAGLPSYFIAGSLATAMEFVAFKGFVYIVPLSVAILVFPPPGFVAPRWKLFVSWVFGAFSMFVIVRVIYGVMGWWEPYINGFGWISAASTEGTRFAPWHTLARLLTQTPLLLGLVLAATVQLSVALRREGRAALRWSGILPECLLFWGAFGALAISPAPYPYNLIHLVPYAFLLAFRYGIELWDHASFKPALLPAAGSVILFSHLVPFLMVTQRHYDWTNYRQERLMSLAEALTDPVHDPVYDGVGLVPLRRSIHFNWFLHSLNVRNFVSGPGPRVRQMLTTRPAAVVIPNYRTDWLTDEDQDFIRDRYVSVADDFRVLGKVLPPGGGSFEIYHAGRYRVSTLKGSDLADTYPVGMQGAVSKEDPGVLQGTLDGVPLTEHPIELCEGTHQLECAADCQPAVVWMGPRLQRIHRIGPGDHRRLFVNWY